MSTGVKFIHRKGTDVVMGYQYIQGEHPPPVGVTVTMGQHGVLARARTAQGEHSTLLDGDWLLETPNGVEIYTDSFVHETFRREDEDEGNAKPVKLG